MARALASLFLFGLLAQGCGSSDRSSFGKHPDGHVGLFAVYVDKGYSRDELRLILEAERWHYTVWSTAFPPPPPPFQARNGRMFVHHRSTKHLVDKSGHIGGGHGVLSWTDEEQVHLVAGEFLEVPDLQHAVTHFRVFVPGQHDPYHTWPGWPQVLARQADSNRRLRALRRP